PSTGLMDLEDLRRRLQRSTPSPRVIIPVDFAGQPSHLPELGKLAADFGAKVIEDAAHSLGAHYHVGEQRIAAGACLHSELAILSFHPIKHITTGEGGAVLSNEPALAERIRRLRSHGIHKDPSAFELSTESPFFGPWYHEQDQLGFNYRITDFQCALGLTQLERLPAFVMKRRELARRYDQALAGTPELAQALMPLRTVSGNEHAYHLYVVRVRQRAQESLESLALRRRALYEHLRQAQIFAQVNYIPVPWQPYYRKRGIQAEDYPGAREFYASCLSLPIFPGMSEEDVDRVLEALRTWTKA
ncbi:MAG: DegT/DnrJ/EryC1/StrS family aminotransferase, partial [Myxococcota bacterium]|nr:DegT/DnrJ/EryC1/StrS family aminotransferase [Myxococcota bacterium]